MAIRKPHTAEIIRLNAKGMRSAEIAQRVGVSYGTVNSCLHRNGLHHAPAPPKHPLDTPVMRRLGVPRGVPTRDVSVAVADRIAAVACRYECTVWEAVDRMLR